MGDLAKLMKIILLAKLMKILLLCSLHIPKRWLEWVIWSSWCKFYYCVPYISPKRRHNRW